MHQKFLVERLGCKKGKLRIARLLGLACTILVPSLGYSAQITFRWDYMGSGAAGFMLYCGLSSGRYTGIVDVGNTETYTLKGLSEGETYQCTVTAYDQARSQSDYSNAVRVYIAHTGICSSACDGDLNHDGDVNALDLGIVKASYGTSDADADLNGDGSVNALDLGIFRSLFR